MLIGGEWIVEFIPFPKVLVSYKMQTVLSRIWTRIDGSILYEDNRYVTNTLEI